MERECEEERWRRQVEMTRTGGDMYHKVKRIIGEDKYTNGLKWIGQVKRLGV